jgi:hypothetical protein
LGVGDGDRESHGVGFSEEMFEEQICSQ